MHKFIVESRAAFSIQGADHFLKHAERLSGLMNGEFICYATQLCGSGRAMNLDIGIKNFVTQINNRNSDQSYVKN